MSKENIGITEEHILAAARALSDQSSEMCGVNADDNWKIYSENYAEDARIALAASAVASTIAALKDEVLEMHRKLAAETLRADQGWQRYEGANSNAQASAAQVAVLASQPAAPVQPERALAEENRQLMAKANEWRDKFTESEESRHELLRLLNEETSRKTFMGEPVFPQRPNVSEMVNRFLGWRLPDTFAPDCGISFDGRKADEWSKNKSWPVGTNLLNAAEAKAMFEYCIAAPPVQQPDDVRDQFEAWAKREGHDNLTRMAGDPDQYDDLILRANYKGYCAALATTRPSAALTDEVKALIANLAAMVRVQNGNRHADTKSLLTHADAILAASSGAEQVMQDTATQAAQPTERLTDERIKEIVNGIVYGDGWDGERWNLEIARAIESALAIQGGEDAQPAIALTGELVEVGDLQDECQMPGLVIQCGDGRLVTVKGMSRDDVRAVAPLYGKRIAIAIDAAILATQSQKGGNNG